MPCSNSRGLEGPGAIQSGMLDFSPRTVQTCVIAKSCIILEWSQQFAILEWGLVNPEKIVSFLTRTKTDVYFRNYYISIYDSLRLLHQRIFDCLSLMVNEAEKKWTQKLNNVLDEEHEDEIVAQRE